MHAKPSHLPLPRWRRFARRVGVAAGLVLVAVALYSVTWPDDMRRRISWLRAPGEHSKAESKLSEARELRERLRVFCWQLTHQRDAIVQRAQQERIAYRIMRRQGLEEGAAAAERLAERQEHWRRGLDAVEDELARAERLLARLENAILPDEIGAGSIHVDPQLEMEVRSFLRLAGQSGADPVIPDLHWSGGADAVMASP